MMLKINLLQRLMLLIKQLMRLFQVQSQKMTLSKLLKKKNQPLKRTRVLTNNLMKSKTVSLKIFHNLLKML